MATQPPVAIRMMKTEDLEDTEKFISKTMTWARETYVREQVSSKALAHYIAFRTKSLLECLNNPQEYCLLAFIGESICGMSLGGFDCGVGTIHWLAVDPDHQGKGIGKNLLRATENLLVDEGCHKMTLVTYPGLVPAISLYLKWGMVPEAFLRKESFGEDNIVMSKWFGEDKPDAFEKRP